LIDLSELPHDFVFSALYKKDGQNIEFNKFRDQLLKSDKFIFVIPEYNGSFPGVLKAFVDGLKYPESFTDKKAALIGISAGSQGAALAMSHFTDILNYLGMNVLAFKPRFPSISKMMDGDKIANATYLAMLERQADLFKLF